MPEPGFYYGAMFISYGIWGWLSLAIVGSLMWFGGMGINGSFAILIGLSALLFPWIFRISRSVWIHIIVKYRGIPKRAKSVKMEENPEKLTTTASEGCGINRWQLLKTKLNNLSAGDFQRAICNNPKAHLLDCRTANEFSDRPLEGADNLDYFAEEFYDRLEALDKDVVYLVYCRSGRRSLRVCTLMQNSGFRNVYNLEGGLIDWDKEFSR